LIFEDADVVAGEGRESTIRLTAVDSLALRCAPAGNDTDRLTPSMMTLTKVVMQTLLRLGPKEAK
jgi:hypothetical protein